MRAHPRAPYGRAMNRIAITSDAQQPGLPARRAGLPAAARHWHGPTVFALVVLCFFFPFATVSCDDASTSFTGIQLVTRTVPHGGHVDEGSDCSGDLSTCVENRGSFVAELALFAAGLGFLLGAIGLQKGPGWCSGVALLAMLDLAATPFDIFGPDVSFHWGFDSALALCGWAAVLHLVRARRRRPALIE